MLRLATGIPLGILMVLIHACPRAWTPYFLFLAFLPLTWFTLHELFQLLGMRQENGRLTLLASVGMLFGIALLLLVELHAMPLLAAWGIAFIMALMLVQIRRFPTSEPVLREPALVMLATLWVAGGLSCTLALRDLGDAWMSMGMIPQLPINPLAMVPIVGCWCYDACALGAGSVAGRTPLAPSISPKKSVEGFAGGLAGGAVGMMLLLWMARHFSPVDWTPPPMAFAVMALLGIALGACSQLGDLAMSCVKREARVKDSASLIPSQGGLLDKADGYLFVAPVAYLMLVLMTKVPPLSGGLFGWMHGGF